MDIAGLLDFKGKVVVVTGGASGMGTGIAKRFAEAGADVAITYLKHEAEAEPTVVMLKSFGIKAVAVRMDQSEVEQCAAMVDTVVEKLGRIDVLISNSGLHGRDETLDLDQTKWDTMMNTNLRGAFFCAQFAAKQMIKQGDGGAIVSISSINSFNPLRKSTHYGAAKAGMNMFTRSMGYELGEYGIRVNAIAPGLIEPKTSTPAAVDRRERFVARAAIKKAGLPSDIGNICLFLASPMSDWITGEIIVADGGVLLSPSY